MKKHLRIVQLVCASLVFVSSCWAAPPQKRAKKEVPLAEWQNCKICGIGVNGHIEIELIQVESEWVRIVGIEGDFSSLNYVRDHTSECIKIDERFSSVATQRSGRKRVKLRLEIPRYIALKVHCRGDAIIRLRGLSLNYLVSLVDNKTVLCCQDLNVNYLQVTTFVGAVVSLSGVVRKKTEFQAHGKSGINIVCLEESNPNRGTRWASGEGRIICSNGEWIAGKDGHTIFVPTASVSADDDSQEPDECQRTDTQPLSQVS